MDMRSAGVSWIGCSQEMTTLHHGVETSKRGRRWHTCGLAEARNGEWVSADALEIECQQHVPGRFAEIDTRESRLAAATRGDQQARNGSEPLGRRIRLALRR